MAAGEALGRTWARFIFGIGGKSLSTISGESLSILANCWCEGVPNIFIICKSWSLLSFPRKRGIPDIISAKMQPHDHKSIEVLYVRDPSKTSGARYHRVTTSFENVFTGTPNALARPKSPSFNSILRLISKFCGFRSRCRTWFSWQKFVPLRSWNMKFRTVAGSSAPRFPCWSI